MREPVLHSHITDGLPDDDPRRWDPIHCVDCRKTVHSVPNECMVAWFDTGVGALCMVCFIDELDDIDRDEQRLGLP